MDDIVYVCDRCGDTFSLEESKRRWEDDQPITCCPNCGSADIEEGERCEVCREIHYPWKLRHGVCDSCFADAVSAFKACIDDLKPWEREVLEYEYGNLDVTEK